ncbi:MAG: LysE family transporter, partial [Pseudomonadota bacterium]|nr:LysE family transporter [Pseudomonadota bacterium]
MDFIPSLPVLAAFTLAVAVLIITPGPDMTLFLGKTLAQGRAAGMAAMLGASTGLIVHTLLAAFGLSALLAASASAFAAVKVAGALYLLWLAVDALRNGSALSLPRGNERRPTQSRGVALGLGLNLLKPPIKQF